MSYEPSEDCEEFEAYVRMDDLPSERPFYPSSRTREDPHIPFATGRIESYMAGYGPSTALAVFVFMPNAMQLESDDPTLWVWKVHVNEVTSWHYHKGVL